MDIPTSSVPEHQASLWGRVTTVDTVRGLIRPVVTLLLVGVLAALTVLLVLRFGSATMADRLVEAVIGVTLIVVGFWFGSRKPGS